MFHRFSFSRHFFLPAGFPSTVPEGGELLITAGGMTVGYVTCGSAGALSPSSPKGANRIPSFSCSPPSGTVVCVVFCFPQVPFPPVISPAVIESSPPSGTVVCVVFCFPQVPFPSVIPPAVIESSPPSGTGGLDAALRRAGCCFEEAGCCFEEAGCCFEEVLLIYFLNA